MDKDTIEKMTQLRMPGMINAYKSLENLNNCDELTFEKNLRS